MAYSIATGTHVNQQSFDCVFSLDTWARAAMTINPRQASGYVSAFHPLFQPTSHLVFLFFSLFTNNHNTALALISSSATAAAVAFFYLILKRLELRRDVIAIMVALYGISFATLLYAVYYDALVLVPAAITFVLYLMLRCPESLNKPVNACGVFLLTVSGLITGAWLYVAFLLTRCRYFRDVVAAVKLLILCVTALVILLLAIKASGWMPSNAIGGFQNHYWRHYSYINAYTAARGVPSHIDSLDSYISWAISNLFDLSLYPDVVMGFFIMPVVMMPVSFDPLFWSHQCTWFAISYDSVQACLGLCVFAFAIAGMVRCFKSGKAFHTLLAVALLGYMGFYGFGYTTLVAYLHAALFVCIYLAVAAIGLSAILDKISVMQWRGLDLGSLARGIVFILLAAIAINNLSQWNVLTYFVFSKFG